MAEQEILFRIKVVDDNSGKLASIEQQLAALRKQREELNKNIKAGNELSQEEAARLAELDAAQKALNQEKRAYNKEIENQIKLNNTNINSLAGMRARLSEMRAEYEKLDPATAKSKKLATEIGNLQDKVNKADFATKNFRGNVGNYTSAVSGLLPMIGLGGGLAGAFILLKNSINSTQVTGDAFAKFIGGTTELTNHFMRSLISLDFTNLINGLRNAYNEGKRYAETLDLIGDMQRALKIQQVDVEIQIIEQRKIARDSTRTLQEREAALDEIIRLERNKTEIRQEVSDEAVNNEIANIQTRVNAEKQAIIDFLAADHRVINERIAAGQRLTDEMIAQTNRVYTDRRTGITTFVRDAQAEQKWIQTLNDEQRESIQIAQINNAITDEQRTKLVEFIVQSKTATKDQASAEEGLIRIRNRLYNELIKGEETIRTEREKSYDEELKMQEKLYNQFITLRKARIKAEEQLQKEAQQAQLTGALSTLGQGQRSTISSISEESEERVMQRLNSEYELKQYELTEEGRLAILKKSLDKQLISEKEYADKVRQIEMEKSEFKLNMLSQTFSIAAGLFEEESIAYKLLASGQAIIDTYRGATAALAPPPVGLGPLFGPILAAVTIASGLANVAKINGVKFQDGGIIEGASHSQGGVQVATPSGVVEAEGGELIVNKGIWQRPDYVRAISTMNYETGGRRFYAMGGILPSMSEPTQGMDIGRYVSDTVNKIAAIPVMVAEEDISTAQRRVQVTRKAGDL